MLGRCPKCGSEVLEGEQDFYCRSSECKFRIGGVVLGQAIHRSQVVKLLADKRTDLLSDFISKAGKKFSAFLVLGQDEENPSKVTFEFPSRDKALEVPATRSTQELKTTGQGLYEAKKYAEAMPILKLAAEAYPKDELLWQQLFITARNTNQIEQAMEFAKLGIRHFPQSYWLWMELGNVLTKLDRLEEAEKALDTAAKIDSDTSWLWRYRVNLHKKTKNEQKQFQAWERLSKLVELDGEDLNAVGIAYYNAENYAKAVEFYRQAAAKTPSAHLFFNIGLAYANPKVSQDVDAADAYRQALGLEPKYEKARNSLEALRPKLENMATAARRLAGGVTSGSNQYQHYFSPYEALQIEDDDGIAFADVKRIQRAKKRLLQEIELNDGKVSWLDNYALDKSRALELDDELLDATKRAFHWEVFQNKKLLRFLTRGEIEHFLYSDDYFPKDDLELLDKNQAFRNFLSKPFAKQYNVILTRAIEQRAWEVVEALFDGRRWVNPEDEDICFSGAHKRVNDLVQLMRAKAEEGVKRKVSVAEVEDLIRQNGLAKLFNLLPANFRSAQSELVAELRQLAISCYNEHGDPDLSRGILHLCKSFQFKNADLNKRLDEDFKIIEEKIAEERKAEVKVQFGSSRPFEITKEGIRDGDKFFAANTVRFLRWGITVNGQTNRYEYVLVVKNDQGQQIMASWSTPRADEEKQTKYFTSMVDACFSYLVEFAIGNIHQRLNAGSNVTVGSCTLTQQGIKFQVQGLIFKKDRFIHWTDLATEIKNGEVIVYSKAARGVSISMPIKDTDNAVLLPAFRSIMEKQRN
jgi:tetratricopeptide (TPR) repeat protein